MHKLTGKNILVTGGTGFVGSHLIEELVKLKTNVITTYLTLQPSSYFISQKLSSQVTLVPVDICDYNKVFDLITKFHIDIIFHLAAQPLVDVAYDNPRRTLESNINGTINIFESVRLYPKVQSIIFASSDKAYGKLLSGKYEENDPLRGDHPYEVSKSAADLIASSYIKTYNLPIVITRFGNIYGEGDLNFSRIIPGIMKSLITKKILELRSNGRFIRDYLYVKDVVNGYLLLAEQMKGAQGEAFNFGSEETLSVLQLISTIEKILSVKVRYAIANTHKNEIPYQSLNYSKIKKKMKWKQQSTLKNTLIPIFEWYKKMMV